MSAVFVYGWMTGVCATLGGLAAYRWAQSLGVSPGTHDDPARAESVSDASTPPPLPVEDWASWVRLEDLTEPGELHYRAWYAIRAKGGHVERVKVSAFVNDAGRAWYTPGAFSVFAIFEDGREESRTLDDAGVVKLPISQRLFFMDIQANARTVANLAREKEARDKRARVRTGLGPLPDIPADFTRGEK